MRVRIATLLAFLILAIACADPLYCVDGCTSGNMATTHSAQTGADCPTCLTAMLPRPSAPLARADRATRLSDIASPAPGLTFHADVDHPPRLA